jgi:4-hydroxy-2-oxoheptanedioate aldolase
MKQMRPSRTLARLRAGKIATCTKLNLADPRVVEIAALAGFDCLWLDHEHTANTPLGIENMVRAAKAYEVDTVVRVPRGSYSDLIHPLEVDATGIMVPHLMSLADARQIVYFTRFHPIGRRPVDGGNADGAFCMISGPDYIRQANEQRFVVVQIEDPEPLAELDAIAQLPGLDMLFFGPTDFSQGIGVPFQFDHPRVGEARRRVAEAARRHGKFAGTVAIAGNAAALYAEGYRFLSLGADVIGLGSYYRDLADSLRALESTLAAEKT